LNVNFRSAIAFLTRASASGVRVIVVRTSAS
jgi:hypothetical protein